MSAAQHEGQPDVSGLPPSVTSPPWSVTTKRVIAVVAMVLLFVFARQVNGSTWSSLTLAAVLAYVMSPVVTFFERRLCFIKWHDMRRTLAVILTWLVVLGVLVLILILVAPATASQLREFADSLPDLFASTEADLERVLNRPISIGKFTFIPWEEIEKTFLNQNEEQPANEDSLTSTLQNTVLSLADPALAVLGGAVQFLITMFFVLVLLFYLMRDGPLFSDYAVQAVPESYRGDMRRLMYELGLIWNAYLRGQLMLNLSVGLATYIAALILGLPQPLVLAFVAGFLEFIPNLGPTLAQIPALLFALTTPSTTIDGLNAGLGFAVVVSLTYIFIQNLEAIFLVPRIMGHSLNLHPIVVLIAVMIGADLFGVLGVILAAPIAASLRLLGRYMRGKLFEEDVFPTEAAYMRQGNRFYQRVIHILLSKRFVPLSERVVPPPRAAKPPSALVVRQVTPTPDDPDPALDPTPSSAPEPTPASPPAPPSDTDVSQWAL